jgi:small-conductance mechanosensitive channel
MPEWVTALLTHPIIGTMLRLVLLSLMFLFVRRSLQLGVVRVERRIERNVEEADRRGRLNTLLRAGYGAAVVLIGAITLAMILQAVNINIGPMLVSAGVAGLAISLGAQTLIKDYIGGVLILAEDHFRVGDVVEVNTVSGEVVRITLRVTYLRNVEGKLHAVPNGDIRTVTNVTRDWSRAVVDLTLEYGAEAERVQRALAGVSARLQADPALAEVLMGPAEVLSWNNNSDLGVQVRIMVKTLAGKHWLVGRVLRQYALEALEAEGLRPARPVTLRPASSQDGA